MYVNTSAEVKAETDYCCTSSNAVQVVEHIWSEHGPEQEILFGPDMWLGAFVERETGLLDDPERRARFHVWDGECHVHAGIRPADIDEMRAEHPEAEFLIHPECGCSTQAMEYVASGDISGEGVHMLSTSGMLDHVEKNPDGSYIVATETGMLYPLEQAAPQADLIAANRMAFCKYMKMITLPKLRDCLRDMTRRGQGPAGDRASAPGPDRAHGRDRLGPPGTRRPLASFPPDAERGGAGADGGGPGGVGGGEAPQPGERPLTRWRPSASPTRGVAARSPGASSCSPSSRLRSASPPAATPPPTSPPR